MHLQQALDKNLIKVSASSKGGYQGFCIQMQIRNLTKDSLTIMVEPGRRLNSLRDSRQDILITKQELISLKQFEGKSFSVKGYCCQATNESPSTGDLYGVGKLADSNLVSLALYLNGNKNDLGAEQQAVWAISDNRPASYITSVKDTGANALRKLVCLLKGEVMPWYSMVSKTLTYQSGRMETVPVLLLGDMPFDCDKESYTTLHVLNEKGEEVCRIIQQWTPKGSGQNYELNLPVNMLVRGKYVIELKTPEKLLVSREFQI
jgi:hypothetical protein